MKRTLALAALFALLAGLCACGGEPASPPAATEPTAAPAITARYDEQYRHVQGEVIDKEFGLIQVKTCGHTFICEKIDNALYIRSGDGETDGILYMPETVNGRPIAGYGQAKNYNCERIRYPNFEGSGDSFSTSYLGVWEVADWEESLFNDRTVVGRYEVSPDNPFMCDIDGVLFNKDATVLLDFPEGYSAARYTIPNTVTEIAEGAFNLRAGEDRQEVVTLDIVIPPSVTKFPEEWQEGTSMCEVVLFVAPGSAAQTYFEALLAQESDSDLPRFRLTLMEFPS